MTDQPQVQYRRLVYEDEKVLLYPQASFKDVISHTVTEVLKTPSKEHLCANLVQQILIALQMTAKRPCWIYPKFEFRFFELDESNPRIPDNVVAVNGETRIAWEVKGFGHTLTHYFHPNNDPAMHKQAMRQTLDTLGQLSRQALSILHSEENIDEVHVFVSTGLFFSLLVFDRPAAHAANAQGAVPDTEGYQEFHERLQEVLAERLATVLVPRVLYFCEPMMTKPNEGEGEEDDDDGDQQEEKKDEDKPKERYVLSAQLRKALAVAAFGDDTEAAQRGLQASWVKPHPEGGDANAQQVKYGTKQFRTQHRDAINGIKQVLKEFIEPSKFEKEGAKQEKKRNKEDKSHRSNLSRETIRTLERRILPVRGKGTEHRGPAA
ncbi:hypothetical protein K466DRAFT_594591 [Polyporus arcularius HHB13444]|uniref:Uncharacterized protein n=1 Tax=Polyporus arcularius HHB13444 TaxID=1314778 RepID=A0A5C3PUX5_9APHY|nr:hypothetical protein K466DRAFT_594591 [Polyporus arcularius HHB13444]